MIKYLDIDGKIQTMRYDEKTTKINLSGQGITQILETSGLSNLKLLQLKNNDITKISGLHKLPALEELELSNNEITEIEGLDNLTCLESLYLTANQITNISGLDKLANMRSLALDYNKIIEINGLDKLIKLNHLWLSNNKITEIKGLNNLINIHIITLSRNNIDKIKGLNNLTNLQDIWLESNKIKKIENLSGLNNLRELWLDSNQISEIQGLDNMENLRQLSLTDNRISEIPNLNNLPHLEKLFLNINNITKIPYTIMNLRNLNVLEYGYVLDPIIERFLNSNRIRDNKTIFDDNQNVHNSNIVKCVKQSIYNIIHESKEIKIDLVLKEIIKDEILNKKTKEQLIEYCQDKTIHSILKLTFDEVLRSVWKIISEHKESKEIKKILNQEMQDSMCKCFTGRLSRLVNCLNGFDSRVSIQISDAENILNIIISIKNKYVDDVERQKEEVKKELTNRGYDKNTIDEYISYLE
jgi:Leucine-rich repeat (LRR) protein